jgi:hypothetical protein
MNGWSAFPRRKVRPTGTIFLKLQNELARVFISQLGRLAQEEIADLNGYLNLVNERQRFLIAFES